MPRPLRFVPEHSMVEITTRTLHGRLLLRPSTEFTDLVLGVVGKAQALYGMTIHAFVFLSTHAHFLLSPTDAGQLAVFMQFVNANVAKEVGRLHGWRERVWSRRYRSASIVVADEKAARSTPLHPRPWSQRGTRRNAGRLAWRQLRCRPYHGRPSARYMV
jgi:hypothetical protein